MFERSRFLLGWVQRGWRWDLCSRHRRRWVHVDHPPRFRSPVMRVHNDSDKLFYICNGYIDKLDESKLPTKLQKRLKRLKRLSVPVNNRRLPWSQSLQDAITRTYVPCLAFAEAYTHNLIEVFTMDEIQALEKLAPEIQKAFQVAEMGKEEQEKADRATEHEALDLHDLRDFLDNSD